MRTGLIALGVVFLVLGGVFYFMPTPTAGATATTVDEQGRDTRTLYASVNLPLQLTIASQIIGVVLLMLGLVLPGPNIAGHSSSKDHLVETKEHIEGNGSKRNIVRERHEQQVNKTA